jgi:hypothetical protein
MEIGYETIPNCGKFVTLRVGHIGGMIMMADIGKTLFMLGIGLSLLGALLWLGGDFLRKIQIGRLPGDFLIQNDRVTFYFPLTTGILISVSLSALLWFIQWLTKR